MNTQSAAFLQILSKCVPKDTELAHESKIQAIIQSDDYRELSKRKAFAEYFAQYFSYEKIRAYSDSDLEKTAKAIPVIPEAIEDIIYSLKNGAAPSLKESDKPDFMDRKSLKKVSEKLHDSTGKNYCNIVPEDFMSIFDKDTIKNLGDIFFDFNDGSTDYVAEIERCLPRKKYCISAAEIKRHEDEYAAKIAELNSTIEDGKGRRRIRFWMKLFIALICILIPTIVGSITGMISSAAIGSCTLVVLVLSIVYVIKG